MNKKQAIACMLGGAKVRLKSWGENEYARIDIDGDVVDKDGDRFSINGYASNGWELYSEIGQTLDEVLQTFVPPKTQLVTIEKWLYQVNGIYQALEGCPEYHKLLQRTLTPIKKLAKYTAEVSDA